MLKLQKSHGGGVVISEDLNNLIYIGFPVLNTSANDPTVLNIEGELHFEGRAFLSQGTLIDIRETGVLELGDGFNSTGKMNIICFKNIKFLKDCTVSWDTLFMDTDSHSIFSTINQERINNNQEIIIGEHCWIGARSTILKGVVLNTNTIVSCESLVLKSISESNIIIGGRPTKVLKNNINWSLDKPV